MTAPPQEAPSSLRSRQRGPKPHRGITIRDSIVGTHFDLEEVVRLHAEAARARSTRRGRSGRSNGCFDEVLREATARPRLVIEF